MGNRLRRVLLHISAGLLYYSGLLRFRFFFRRVFLGKQEICVLALHRVLSEEEEARTNSPEGMIVRKQTFARLLDFLNREFHVISLQELLRGIENGQSDARPRCLLTFDDGWKDNFTNAYPLLRKFPLPATIFLVTGQLGTKNGSWVEQLGRSWKNPSQRNQLTAVFAEILPQGKEKREVGLEEFIEYAKRMPAEDRTRLLQRVLPTDQSGEPASSVDQMMTWEEVTELARNGVEIGAHTVTHPLLTHEGAATIQKEVRLSKVALENHLDAEVRAFAYPNGDWDERVREEVEQAGFRCAFTTQRRWYCRGGNLATIPRFIIHEKKITGAGGKFSPAMLSLTLARCV